MVGVCEAAGEGKAEAVEELGLSGVGFGDAAEAEGFLRAVRGFSGEGNVAAFDLGQFIQESAGCIAQAGGGHPAGERLPHRVGQKGDIVKCRGWGVELGGGLFESEAVLEDDSLNDIG